MEAEAKQVYEDYAHAAKTFAAHFIFCRYWCEAWLLCLAHQQPKHESLLLAIVIPYIQVVGGLSHKAVPHTNNGIKWQKFRCF